MTIDLVTEKILGKNFLYGNIVSIMYGNIILNKSLPDKDFIVFEKYPCPYNKPRGRLQSLDEIYAKTKFLMPKIGL